MNECSQIKRVLELFKIVFEYWAILLLQKIRPREEFDIDERF